MASGCGRPPRPQDTVARLGGDEFTVLCEGIGDEHTAVMRPAACRPRSTRRSRSPACWSLSGPALGGVFVTCGVSHLVAGLTTTTDWHTLLFDIPGVPFSLNFLWVVHRLRNHSLRDWNRRPLVGRASRQSRPSPWAAT